MARVVWIQQRAQVFRIGGCARLVEAGVARECVDGTVARVHDDRGPGVGVEMTVGVRECDPVPNRLLCDPLQAQVDRELKSACWTRHADHPRRTDRAAAGIDHDSRLLEPPVQQPIVARLGAGLADDRTGSEA